MCNFKGTKMDLTLTVVCFAFLVVLFPNQKQNILCMIGLHLRNFSKLCQMTCLENFLLTAKETESSIFIQNFSCGKSSIFVQVRTAKVIIWMCTGCVFSIFIPGRNVFIYQQLCSLLDVRLYLLFMKFSLEEIFVAKFVSKLDIISGPSDLSISAQNLRKKYSQGTMCFCVAIEVLDSPWLKSGRVFCDHHVFVTNFCEHLWN